ncbi:hypothetical protein BGX38DRAFT_1267178 [Terfezia claveryi]|nr:hypothetical protein BGX38DRAFT_1267178 [Terfezia claveryi]
MAARAGTSKPTRPAPKAIFGESHEHDAIRLLMFVYIAIFDDEPTARDVPNWPAHEIRQRFQLLTKDLNDVATDTEATISSIKSWTFNSQLPLTKLCEQLEALGKPHFDGNVMQAYYKWDEMRSAAGAFQDSELESACAGVGQAISSLAMLSSQAEEMIASLRLRNFQATANMLRGCESVGHDTARKEPPRTARAGKANGSTAIVFEDWELVAILTLPSIRAGGIAAELTTFRSLYYKASCFLQRPLIHDRQFIIAVREAHHLVFDKLGQMMDTLTTQFQQSVKSLQCLLKYPWSFHTSLQWQFDTLAKHDVQLHTTLHRAECLFLEWQVAMRTITNPLLNKAATGLGREIIALRLALSAVNTRHKGIRGKVECLWAIRGEFIQEKIDRDGVGKKMNTVLSVEDLQCTVKIHTHTLLRTDPGQSQGCPSAGFSCLMSEACLNNLTSPSHTPKELGCPNLMTPAEALAVLLAEHTGQPQNWKPEPVTEDPAELQRRYEANVDAFHYLFPGAEDNQEVESADDAYESGDMYEAGYAYISDEGPDDGSEDGSKAGSEVGSEAATYI